MIARLEPAGMQLFEKSSGMKAFFSGTELSRLKHCCLHVVEDAFIHRLVHLKILPAFNAGVRQAILTGLEEPAGLAPEAVHIEPGRVFTLEPFLP